ncbi:UreD urease accessory protein [Xylona heveae TC161]|uniref:UreD urease accessory protein n=1 Tax=Xylona heveae (strain CBS 132557 / TC161) TaxID=1328760 RepID=A0A165JRH4_XYLHT|nr:UreD urease accessory protein [Xylona heveae TC161]KZF26544.1 UreD urease accessory protein [Xylona heveae TC161]
MSNSSLTSPFASATLQPGHGLITLVLLLPSSPTLQALTYQYPLKLIAPDPITLPSGQRIVLAFLLTYGGGLVAGDSITLHIELAPQTRLALATQGSTKLFKSPSRSVVSRQTLDVVIRPGAALCYLPDPTQPFAGSCYEQKQVFHMGKGSSLCMLDWVSEGRRARGERWSFRRWTGKNEIWTLPSVGGPNFRNPPPSPPSTTEGGKEKEDIPALLNPYKHGAPRLLLRDHLILDGDEQAEGWPEYSKNEYINREQPSPPQHRISNSDIRHSRPSFTGDVPDSLAEKMDALGVFATLILRGPLFATLGTFFLDEFTKTPRIGARNWSGAAAPDPNDPSVPLDERRRRSRIAQETKDGVIWTAAHVRGNVLVKFGAREVEGARRWCGDMLRQEGSVEREFGESALLCLR